MSHGEENDEIIFSDGRKQTLFNCLEPLWNCEGLRGKPKLVITQEGFQFHMIHANETCMKWRSRTIERILSKNEIPFWFCRGKQNEHHRKWYRQCRYMQVWASYIIIKSQLFRTDSKTLSRDTCVNMQCDTAICYATASGNIAVRSADSGSPFIETICKYLNDSNIAFFDDLKENFSHS